MGKRSIMTRMLEIGSSTIKPADGTDNEKWNLRTKYFTAELQTRIAVEPFELGKLSEAVFEVGLIVLH